jgi:hypothetical protein
VNAKFEPGIGEPHTNFTVIPTPGDAGVRIAPVNFPAACWQYAVTALGTVLCASQDELVTQRDEHIPGKFFAINGNVVWSVTAGPSPGIERRVDDGTSFKMTHRIERPLPAVAFLQAGLEDAYLLPEVPPSFMPGDAFPALLRVRSSPDGGLLTEKLAAASEAEVRGMTVRTDDVLLLGVTSAGQPRVTSLLADGGFRQFPSPFGGGMGGDDAVLWGRDDLQMPHRAQLLALRPSGSQLTRAELTLPSSVGILPLSRLAISPWSPLFPMSPEFDLTGRPLNPRVVLPWFDGSNIRLEYFDPGPDYAQVVSATRTHAFARSLDGKTVKVFSRQRPR